MTELIKYYPDFLVDQVIMGSSDQIMYEFKNHIVILEIDEFKIRNPGEQKPALLKNYGKKAIIMLFFNPNDDREGNFALFNIGGTIITNGIFWQYRFMRMLGILEYYLFRVPDSDRIHYIGYI